MAILSFTFNCQFGPRYIILLLLCFSIEFGQLYILVSDPDLSAIFITGGPVIKMADGSVFETHSYTVSVQVSELSSLLRQVISGQAKLSEQVSGSQEWLCTVGSGLSSLQSAVVEKKNTNRVASKLSVSHVVLVCDSWNSMFHALQRNVSLLYNSFGEEEMHR